jgi:archaellum biogenesis ATPase FlaH
MIEVKGGKKEQIVREWINNTHEGKVPSGKVLDAFGEFQMREGSDANTDISYVLFNAVLKKIVTEGGETAEHATPAVKLKPVVVHSVEPVIIKVEDMAFPEFKLHTSGKKIDDLFSDHEEGGGMYGGTVNIVIGESGVGKSTVLLDHLSSIMNTNPEAKILYVSSEMTRNDILFYYKKTPAIGKVPTLLLMDYMANGQLSAVLEKTFNGQFDVIVLDSYQDVLVKLKEAQGWKSTQAESWLTNMMIDAAEKNGTAVLAIQHMTKGGTYVGSTYLKHATTAMLEIRFDLSGQRYIEFSKNRRGGSGVGKRLYYSLDETGSVVYDVQRFTDTEVIREIESTESIRQHDLTRTFESIFLTKAPDTAEDSVVGDVVELERGEEPAQTDAEILFAMNR